jgi:hypothetical protein
MVNGPSFFRTIEGSSALRARLRLGFEKAEASLSETLAEETEAAAGDPTPQLGRHATARSCCSREACAVTERRRRRVATADDGMRY